MFFISFSSNSFMFWQTFSEPVLEFTPNDFQMTHSTSSSSLPPFCFDRPVVWSHLFLRVPTLCTLWFLNVIWTTSTSSAQCVRLIATLTKAGCTLRHLARRSTSKEARNEHLKWYVNPVLAVPTKQIEDQYREYFLPTVGILFSNAICEEFEIFIIVILAKNKFMC